MKLLQPQKTERLSPEEYLALPLDVKKNIQNVRFVAAELGDDDFGAIEVEYQNPILRPYARQLFSFAS